MSILDRYYLKDKYTYYNQEMMNVYFFYQAEGSGKAQELATAFEELALLSILNLQVSAVVHTSLEVINVDDLNDFVVHPLTTANEGSRTGDGLPAFNAWGFTLNRATRSHRSGHKRIAGVSETDTSAGNPASAIEANLTAYCTTFSEDISYEGDVYTLVIPIIGAPPGNDPPATGFISSVTFTRLTTQNSRKR